MATLLLQLVGPMQSWGVQSRFRIRDTGREPSKSGLVGMLCAAIGRPRNQPVNDLASLRMAVRVDREGRLLRDFQTAGKGGYLKASGALERKNLIVSTRYYLADAAFLAGFEGDRDFLAHLQSALRDPRWPLYLGRKAYVPGAPVWLTDGLKKSTLEQAIGTYRWIGRRPKEYKLLTKKGRVRLVIDDPQGAETRADHPLSFAQRTFAYRRVTTAFIEPPSFDKESVTDLEVV
jgi:CRISPR system Cascade subunit CasD